MHTLNYLQNIWGKFTFLLAVSALLILIYRQLIPSWRLLRRSLPQHGRSNLSWQATATLYKLLVHGLQLRSLSKATRLRIEIELLDRAPERPLRVRSNTDQEYAAVKEEWKLATKKWSDRINRRLEKIAKQEEADRTIVLDNCQALLGDDNIARYFNACGETSFLSKVTIKSGFVAPLHLLTGVLAYNDEQWKPVVDAYGRSVIRPDDPLRYKKARKLQSFIFDCWLLWGPSTPICTCPEWHGEVALQYGYGDENTSLTLRCSSPEILRTLAGPDGGSEDGLALRAHVSGTLKWGPGLGTAGFCPAQVAIWQDQRLVLDVVGEADGIRPAGGTEEQVFAQYYSAYLWIIFVMCEEDPGAPEPRPRNPVHKWRDLIPFFIHANIADREAYDFYANQLARGAVEAAMELLHAEPDLVLRFACAIDETGCGYHMRYEVPIDKISTRMQRFAGLAEANEPHGKVLQRLRFDVDDSEPFCDGDYSACALPEIVNDYYRDIEEEAPTFHELRSTRDTDLDLLRAFYDDCFVPEFPDENERESYDQIENYLRLKETGWYGKNNYHVIVVLGSDNKPIGGAIADYLNEPNAGVIEYIVIQPEHRRTGWGRRLLEETERTLHDDADKSRNCPLDWIAAEIDDPFVTQRPLHGIDPFAVARTWHNWGYRFLDFPYVQPALADDKRPVGTLLLSAKLCAGGKLDDKHSDEEVSLVPRETVTTLLYEYQRWAMRIPEPQNDPPFTTMCNSLAAKDNVELKNLSTYLGWETKQRLHVNEVIKDSDPELDRAVGFYERVFEDKDTAIDGEAFRNAFTAPDGSTHRHDYRYHLWTLRSDARSKECEGMVSFLRTPSAGFCGPLGLLDTLGDLEVLRTLVARVEERMVRDGGHMVREGEQLVRDGEQKVQQGRRKGRLGAGRDMVRAGEQMMRAGRQKLRDDEMQGRDARGARGWYLECDDEAQRDSFARLGFWEVDVEYTPSNEHDGALHLMYKPFGRVYEEPPTIQKEAFVQAFREIGQYFNRDNLCQSVQSIRDVRVKPKHLVGGP